jgi:4-amino-4-deoxy-L-arabinose transferase-like glycosyltransferase
MRNRHSETARLAAGAVAILLGVAILLNGTFNLSVGAWWPAFIILPGLALLAAGTGGAQASRRLAVAGAIVTTTGIILLVQDRLDYYRSWAYAWTLLIAAAGAAEIFVARRNGDEDKAAHGRDLVFGGVAAFLALAVIFEVLVFNGGMRGARYVLALILIGGGAWALFNARGRSGEETKSGKSD